MDAKEENDEKEGDTRESQRRVLKVKVWRDDYVNARGKDKG